ncbi:MAG: aminotransferase class IV family protein [Candidatus Omnitrophica bacterium]|nr:aminotransferase class IV family protein [Candidatus Omnitrophota bacterium]
MHRKKRSRWQGPSELNNGCVFAQEAHLVRILNACPVLGIAPPDKGLLRLAIKTIMEEKHLVSARLQLKVFKTDYGTQVVISARKLTGLRKSLKGFSVLLTEDERMAAGALTAIKSTQRGFYERIFKKAKERGYDEVIFLNTRGEVVEGTRTNIFFVKNGKVITPALASGCLPGVTRKIVIALCKRMKIPCREKRVAPKELFEADEIFLTNSIIEVMAVTLLNKKAVGDKRPAALTKTIASAYKNGVEKACCLVSR